MWSGERKLDHAGMFVVFWHNKLHVVQDHDVENHPLNLVQGCFADRIRPLPCPAPRQEIQDIAVEPHELQPTRCVGFGAFHFVHGNLNSQIAAEMSKAEPQGALRLRVEKSCRVQKLVSVHLFFGHALPA